MKIVTQLCGHTKNLQYLFSRKTLFYKLLMNPRNCFDEELIEKLAFKFLANKQNYLYVCCIFTSSVPERKSFC